VDSIFMMPHLGVLSQVHEDAATQVFDRDCMIYLGSAVAPIGTARPGDRVCTYKFKWPDGSTDEGELRFGELKLFPKLAVGEVAEVEINPTRAFDCGNGRGHAVKAHVFGGVVGVVLDGRGRPLYLSENHEERRKQLLTWFAAMNAYPDLSAITDVR